MGKKLCLVLGNGFTIDLIRQAKLEEKIDAINLFSKGAELPFPETDDIGFLSYKNCPNLWNLGIKPNATKNDVMSLLEDVITCVNVRVLRKEPKRFDGSIKSNDIYINAYHELTSYLRVLFSHYNSLVTDQELNNSLANWDWLNFLKRANDSDIYDSIDIITYNYDIWLERLLKINNVAFRVSQVQGGDIGEEPKITIIKPHGSISFYHKNQSPASFEVKYDRQIIEDAITDDFRVDYKIPLSKCIVSALIPPAGDTERIKQSWCGQIRVTAAGLAKQLKNSDELMICGISYWHVDRTEIDEILTKCSPDLNVYMFNPYPNKAMDAVFTSLFKNYVYHNSSSVLKRRLM